MPTIDDRVVRMTFDSSRFNRAIQSTLKLVETFEQSLSFKNAESGFKRLQMALDGLSAKKASNEIDGINDSIDDIDGAKAAKQMESVQQSIDGLDSKSAVDSLQSVQDSMDDIDAKNVSDQISAVNESVNKSDPTMFQDMIYGMQSAADNFNLNGVLNAVDGLSTELPNRFGMLGTVIQGALLGIGNDIKDKIVGVFNGITKSITDPMRDGLQEYQTQMGAIQTILANTGRDFNSTADIAEVNAALDELNTYADKTIYNFTEMTKNIGTFTAAGISMEEAVPAIQGVANMAAISGSTSQQASNAMYQLSQALSTGSLKLQDWNSVVNAGMGGKVFQEALIRTARNMYEVSGRMGEITSEGYTLEEMFDGLTDGTYSFRETLTTEWISSDVLSQTLQQLAIEYGEVGDARYENAKASLLSQGYTEEEAEEILRLAKVAEESATKVRTWDQLLDTTKEALGSGWTETWRIIIGDFKDATNLFTDLSNEINGIIGALAAGRNGVLQSWFDWGGRDALFGIYEETESGLTELVEKGVLQHVIDAIKGWATPISDAFNEVFGIFSDNFDKEYADVISEFGANSEEAAVQYEHTLSTVYENVKNNNEEYKKAVKDYTKSLEEIAKSDGTESKAYKDKQKEMEEALDAIVKGSDDYQDALRRLDETFKNATYDEAYAYSVQAVNEATDKLKEHEEKVLGPVVAQFGKDSNEYKAAVKNMNASDEHKQLVANVQEAEKALQQCRDDYLKPVIEQYGEDSEEYRDAVFRLENSTEVLYDTFNTSTGVMDWVGQDLSALTQGLKDFAATLVPSEDAMIGIKGAFEGLFAVVDLAVHAFVDLLGLAGGLISFVRIFTDPVFDFGLELLGALGQVILSIHDALLTIKNSIVAAFNSFNSAIFGSSNAIEVIRNIYQGFLSWLDIPGKLQVVVDFIRDVIGSIAGFIATGIGHIAEFGDRVRVTIEEVKKVFKDNKSIETFMTSFSTLGQGLYSIWEAITSGVVNFTKELFGSKEAVEETEQSIEPFQFIVDIFKTLADIIGTVANAFKSVTDSIPFDAITQFISSIGSIVGGAIIGIKNGFGDLINSVVGSVDIFGALSGVWNGLIAIGGTVFSTLFSIGSVISNTVIGAFGSLVDIFKPILTSLGLMDDGTKEVNNTVEETGDKVSPVLDILKTFGEFIKNVGWLLSTTVVYAFKLATGIIVGFIFVVGIVIKSLIEFIDIPGKIAAAIEWLSSAFSDLKNFIAPVVDSILDFVTNITDMFGVTGQIQGVVDSIREFFGISEEGFTESGEKIDGMKQAMAFFVKVQQGAITLWDEIVRVAGEIKDAVLSFEPLKDIVDIFGKLRDDLVDLPKKIPLTDESGNIILFSEAMKVLTDTIGYFSTLTPEKLFNDIITQVDNFIGWIQDTGSNLIKAVQSPKNLINGIPGFAQNIASNIEKFFPRVGGILSNGIQGLIDSAANLFSDGSFDSWISFGSKIVDWLKDIPNKISEGFNSFVDSLQKGENDLPPHMKEIGKHIGDFLDTLRNFDIAGVFNNIVDGIKNIPDTLGNIAERIKNAFLGIKDTTEESSSVVSGVNPTASGNGVAGALSEAEQTEEDVDILAAITQTISDKVRAIGEFIQNIPASISEAIPKVARTIGDTINAVLDYINDEMIGRLSSIFMKVAGCIAIWNALKLEKGIGSFLTGAGNLMNHMAGVESDESVSAKFRDVMIGLAIGLGSIALVVSVFSIIPPEMLDKAITGVVKVMGALAIFYALSAVIDKFLSTSEDLGGSMLKAAASISVMGIGFVVITKVIDYLSDWILGKQNDIPKVLAGLATMAVLGAAIAGMLLALSVGGKYALQAAAAMVVVSAALFALTKVIDILSEFVVDKDWEQLGKIAAALGGLVGAMIGFGYAMSLVGEHGIGAAIGLLGFGAAINMVADAFTKLASIDLGQFAAISFFISVLVGEFLGALALAEKTNMLGVAAGFISFGASLMLIGETFKSLSSINYDQLVLIAQAMVILVGEFGIIANFVKTSDLLLTGLSLIEFGAALGVMSISLKQLADVPVETLKTTGIALGLLVGAFGLVTAFTKEGDIIASGLALIEFAGSIAIMAISLKTLSDVPVDQVQKIGDVLIALTASFGIFAVVLAAIPSSTPVILAFGFALIELGLAANLLAAAFQTTVGVLPQFIELVPSLSAAFGDITNHLLDYLGAALGLVAAGAALGVFSLALGTFGVAALAAGAGATVLAGGIQALIDIFSGQSSNFESAGGNIMDGLVNGIITGAQALPGVILGVAQSILGGFLSFLGINSPSTVMDELVGQNIDAGIVEGITSGLPGIGDSIMGGLGGILGNIPTMLSENAPAIQEWFFNTAIPTLGEWIGMAWDAICNFFNENWPKFTDWLMNVAIPGAQDWLFNTGIPMLGEWIMNAWDAICNFFNENWPKFTDWLMNVAIPGVGDWFVNTLLPGLGEWIRNAWDGICNFVNENWPKFVDWLINTAIPGIADWFVNTLLPGLGEWIGNVFTNILTWLGEKKNEVGDWLRNTAIPGLVDWAKSIPGKILDGIGDIAKKFITTGENIVKGIKDGVLNGVDWVCNAIRDLGGSALGAIKDFFHIASPSKVMRDEVGLQIAKGMELGILDYADKIKSTSAQLGETIGSNIGNGIASGMASTSNAVAKSGETTIGALKKAMNDANNKASSAKERADQARRAYEQYESSLDYNADFIAYKQQLSSMGLSDDEWLRRVNDSQWIRESNRLFQEWQKLDKEHSDLSSKAQKATEQYQFVSLLGDDNTRIDTSTWSVVSDKPKSTYVGIIPVETKESSGSITPVRTGTASSVAGIIAQNDQSKLLNSVNHIDSILGSMVSYTKSTNDRLSTIQKQMTQMNDDINNLKIYMDTGSLVGAIAPKMDEALGQRQRYADRGILVG